MPLGFKRTNKRRKSSKHQTSHERRQNLDSALRAQLQGAEDFKVSGVKQEQMNNPLWGSGAKGGLSRYRPQASHRKQTTRQKNPPIDV